MMRGHFGHMSYSGSLKKIALHLFLVQPWHSGLKTYFDCFIPSPQRHIRLNPVGLQVIAAINLRIFPSMILRQFIPLSDKRSIAETNLCLKKVYICGSNSASLFFYT